MEEGNVTPTAKADHSERSIGLWGATGIGVGAIVGGGILALAGVAYSVTGPSAIVAFGLNGLVALLTALSFAEMATTFPQSGGTYTFAKKVLSVEAAFLVGWVVWFASIVAATLYALGFASFVLVAGHALVPAEGPFGGWLQGRGPSLVLAVVGTIYYTIGLLRRRAGGGQWETIGKVLVFGVLIVAGGYALARHPIGDTKAAFSPFFIAGAGGLIQAMGFTFIALQGFDLIAAVAGEVKTPRRNLPRSMLLSLGAALAIYMPLLAIVAVLGPAPGETIAELAGREPEAVIAVAAQRFMGGWGFWLVVVAGLLSMLSALQANLLAASRVARAMAIDRNLPARFALLHSRRGTPVAATILTSTAVIVLLLLLPSVAAAGAAASLVFLISFALAHWTNILTRRRGGGGSGSFSVPFFPLVPVLGGGSCVALALFQGIAVPRAGLIVSAWLIAGGVLYFVFFASRAGVLDASSEALDPDLTRLRGRSPLVLVPIAKPASAESLVALAAALTPPGAGRVLLLSVVRPPVVWKPEEIPPQLIDAQTILGRSLTASFASSLSPEALVTVAPQPMKEIARVSATYACESLVLGLGDLATPDIGFEVERLLNRVDADVVMLHAPPGWRLADVSRVLVPVGGRRDQSRLRARLLGSLSRGSEREVEFLGVLPGATSAAIEDRWRGELARLADDEAPGFSTVEVVKSDDVGAVLVDRAAACELVVLGLQRQGRRRKLFGDLALRVARKTGAAVVMISRRG